MSDKPDEPVPRLPRGKWFGGNVRTIELLRIGMVGTLLVVIIVLGRPCADGMASFVEGFGAPPDAGPPPRQMKVERLTEEEIKRRFPGSDAGSAPR